MSSRRGAERHFWRRALEAAAFTLPPLVALLFVLYAITRDQESSAAPAPVVIVQAKVEGPTRAALSRAVAPEPGGRVLRSSPATGDSPRRANSEPSTSPIVWALRGQTVEVFDAPEGELVGEQGPATEFGSPTVFSVQRERRGWLGVSTPLVDNGDLGWVRADTAVLGVGYVDHSIEVDLSERSVQLLQGDDVIRSWTATIGAADTPTPTGRFAVTDTFVGGLNPVYGCCAVAISATQPNLPSGWLGGNRIAFHGSGTGDPLGIAASNGCIRSTDDDVRALVETVPLGTPVTIRE